MDQHLNNTKEKMAKAIESLKNDLSTISTGRANPDMLNPVRVDAYGAQMPITQTANISVADSTTISVQVWDAGLVKSVEKAIINANLGLTPATDGQLIRINVPKLSEERRIEFVKLAKKYGEDRKISIRNARRDSIDRFKKENEEGASKDDIHAFTSEVQKITDDNISIIDTLVTQKEQEIMTV